MERRQYKALNFDLDTNALKKYYPNRHYRQAYRDIHSFLIRNGFEHRQWSGYKTVQPMSDTAVTLVVAELGRKYVWLGKCVNHFDVTNVGQNYDLTAMLNAPDIAEPNVKKEPEQLSIAERFKEAQVKAKRKNSEREIRLLPTKQQER